MAADDTDLARYLEVFPAWLGTLGKDAGELGAFVAGRPQDDLARFAVSGLNYIFKSLDLIPDGIDDLGFCDDAFVIRVACRLAVDGGEDPGGVVGRLANDAKLVEEFLEGDYVRLVGYVEGLRKGAARGRTVEDIMTDDAARAAFLTEISAWSTEYKVPSFTKDVKTLIKLKAFLSAKLS